MGDLLIRGMEMPKAGQEIIIAENWDGTIYARLESLGDWCPLVEVPPHGRLIDADGLLTHVIPNNPDAEFHCVDVRDIENAPIVIEAGEVADE